MKINLYTVRDGERVRKELDIPTGWSQVTFKQYLAIIKVGNDTIKSLAVFTGLDESILRKAQIKNLGAVTACLHFLNKPPVYSAPKSILGHRVVDNLDMESIAQYSDLQAICAKFKPVEDITKDIDNIIFNYNQFPLIVATYALETYDFKQAEYLAPKFFNAPCTEVLAIGNFTWARLAALKSGINPRSLRGDILPNRWKLALINWLQTLASTIRYATWKRSLPSNERKYLNGQ